MTSYASPRRAHRSIRSGVGFAAVVVALAVTSALLTMSGASASPVRPARSPAWFSSPSHNIGCYVDRAAARCDIRHHSYQAPKKPKSCHLDWGDSLYVIKRAHWTCHGDTTLGARRVLRYGHSIKVGRFKCTSRRSGMRCRNVRTHHGFKLSREVARRF